jgi:DNA-binding IscR family transcriptional regulator
MLARAGLIDTRPGAGGGAWLKLAPADIGLDQVLRAVEGCTRLGVPPPGVAGCPVGERIPAAVMAAITAADQAAAARLSTITVADLLGAAPETL